MLKALRSVLLVPIALIASVSCRADVIYSNFGPDMAYGLGGPPVYGSSNPLLWQADAVPFTPSADYIFDDAKVPLVPSGPGGSFELLLQQAAPMGPGQVLDTAVILNVPAVPTILTLTSSTHPILSAGTEYFLTVAPVADGAFATLGENVLGRTGYATTHAPSLQGIWVGVMGPLSPAFEIDGTPVAATPEPATFALVGGGLLGLCFARRFAGGAVKP